MIAINRISILLLIVSLTFCLHPPRKVQKMKKNKADICAIHEGGVETNESSFPCGTGLACKLCISFLIVVLFLFLLPVIQSDAARSITELLLESAEGLSGGCMSAFCCLVQLDKSKIKKKKNKSM